jgi:hypothetical protein
MLNLAHSASFHACWKTAPSNPGIKHLVPDPYQPMPKDRAMVKLMSSFGILGHEIARVTGDPVQ